MRILSIVIFLVLGATLLAQETVVMPASYESKTEVEAAMLMNLSRAEIVKFHALSRRVAAMSAELDDLPSMQERMARGNEINKEWTTGLKSIVGPQKWSVYSAYWRFDPTFEAAESKVRSGLKLTPKQIKSMGALDGKRKTWLLSASTAWNANDSEAVATKTMALIDGYRTGLKSILTTGQLAGYEKAWAKNLNK